MKEQLDAILEKERKTKVQIENLNNEVKKKKDELNKIKKAKRTMERLVEDVDETPENSNIARMKEIEFSITNERNE